MNKLSVVIATRNEEENISRCIKSVEGVADEIIIFDEFSTDNTVEIARKLGAKVYSVPHQDNFHITKQKALEKAKNEWILQLDADESVSPELFKELIYLLKLTQIEVNQLKIRNPKKVKLFLKHQELIEKRDGVAGSADGDIVAFFLPRVNMFLGYPLRYGGVYPDGVIRLVKNGFARFPQKSVHEQIHVDGRVFWLENDLLHFDSPTLSRYFLRLNRYTDLNVTDFKNRKLPKNIINFVNFTLVKPIYTFLNIYFRHKGFKDGVPGFLWAFFSSTHFPIAYFKYLVN